MTPNAENIYRYQFVCRCPANAKPIMYTLEITSGYMIHAEDIIAAAALQESSYHEALADYFYNQFGGRHVMRADHHGVNIETRRGFA